MEEADSRGGDIADRRFLVEFRQQTFRRVGLTGAKFQAFFSGNDNLGSEVEKKAMFDDARTAVKGKGKPGAFFRIFPTGAIQNDVSLIAEKKIVVFIPPDDDPRAEIFQIGKLRFPAERHDFHGQDHSFAESGDHLCSIDDNYLAVARLGNDLFPQKRAAAALDAIEGAVHLIGAVDG